MPEAAQEAAPVYFSQADEQPFSGPLLVELIHAVLARGLPFRFRAGGSSMFPFIRDGDVISVVPLSGSAPQFGEVLAFCQRNTGQLVVHRVVGRKENGWILKGDNFAHGQLDGPITRENVLGVVSSVERNGREIRLGLRIERFLIALCSRLDLLRPSVWFAVILYRPFRKIHSFKSRPVTPA